MQYGLLWCQNGAIDKSCGAFCGRTRACGKQKLAKSSAFDAICIMERCCAQCSSFSSQKALIIHDVCNWQKRHAAQVAYPILGLRCVGLVHYYAKLGQNLVVVGLLLSWKISTQIYCFWWRLAGFDNKKVATLLKESKNNLLYWRLCWKHLIM